MVVVLLLAYDPGQVKPGVLAFLIVAALGVATYFLIRSMNKQLKKINFEEEPPRGESGADRSSGSEGAAEAALRDEQGPRDGSSARPPGDGESPR